MWFLSQLHIQCCYCSIDSTQGNRGGYVPVKFYLQREEGGLEFAHPGSGHWDPEEKETQAPLWRSEFEWEHISRWSTVMSEDKGGSDDDRQQLIIWSTYYTLETSPELFHLFFQQP